MRFRVGVLLGICAALITAGCGGDEQMSMQPQLSTTGDPGIISDEVLPSGLGVTHVEYSYPYDLDDENPWVYCSGELMQEHGIVEVHIRETTLPTGAMVVRGWVDYNAYGGVTIEELSSGYTWTLTNGHNPFGEVLREDGFYVLHYQWHELFTSEDRGMLHLRVMGQLVIDPNGEIRVGREEISCF